MYILLLQYVPLEGYTPAAGGYPPLVNTLLINPTLVYIMVVYTSDLYLYWTVLFIVYVCICMHMYTCVVCACCMYLYV